MLEIKYFVKHSKNHPYQDCSYVHALRVNTSALMVLETSALNCIKWANGGHSVHWLGLEDSNCPGSGAVLPLQVISDEIRDSFNGWVIRLETKVLVPSRYVSQSPMLLLGLKQPPKCIRYCEAFWNGQIIKNPSDLGWADPNITSFDSFPYNAIAELRWISNLTKDWRTRWRDLWTWGSRRINVKAVWRWICRNVETDLCFAERLFFTMNSR